MQLFQGEKPAHDFLSLHTGGGPSSPVQQQHPAQGYESGAHSSLKPMKLDRRRRGGGGGGAIDMAPSSGLESDSEEHVLPGGVGTFSIRQNGGGPAAWSRIGSQGSQRPARDVARFWRRPKIQRRERRGGEKQRQQRRSGAQHTEIQAFRYRAAETDKDKRQAMLVELEILRELLPHGDQKRDKASFLLEVIEYIRFLQEKVQKYESAQPEKNHEDSSMPWAKVYYRSCWKNTEATSKAKCRADNSVPGKQPPWLSMSTSDADNKTLSKNEKQTLQEDTQSLSDAYSQGLLNRLTQALKRSGVDPSQASISVEISMDRRATEPNNIHDNLKDHECEDIIHVTKKLRGERSKISSSN
ncbi:Transcription factor BIM3 [Zea mays]|uniref:Transcription factor BIM3 n=1 Tax=Zea mays TaxID=4577 RepID=A0A1D6HJ34_MAIZE|nr:Transcription factor BIM3 [Zea mays]